MTTPTGEANGNARLTYEQVTSAKAMRAAGATFVQIGGALGVDESTVRRAVAGTSWKDAGVPDPRSAMADALGAMSAAHDALATSVNPDTIRVYADACRDARVAFEALVLSGFERAKARRAGL